MSVIERGLDSLAVISDHLNEVVRRRLRELAGLGLIALRLHRRRRARHLVGAGPEPQPRHQRAGAQHARRQGAIVADLLMQLLGLASVVLVLPVAILGWRLLTHRPLYRERWRLLLWIVAAVLAAALRLLPAAHARPGRCRPGLGGVIGDALLRVAGLLLRRRIAGVTRSRVAGRHRRRWRSPPSPSPRASAGATPTPRKTTRNVREQICRGRR